MVFDPNTDPNLKHWLDFSDTNTFKYYSSTSPNIIGIKCKKDGILANTSQYGVSVNTTNKTLQLGLNDRVSIDEQQPLGYTVIALIHKLHDNSSEYSVIEAAQNSTMSSIKYNGGSQSVNVYHRGSSTAFTKANMYTGDVTSYAIISYQLSQQAYYVSGVEISKLTSSQQSFVRISVGGCKMDLSHVMIFDTALPTDKMIEIDTWYKSLQHNRHAVSNGQFVYGIIKPLFLFESDNAQQTLITDSITGKFLMSVGTAHSISGKKAVGTTASSTAAQFNSYILGALIHTKKTFTIVLYSKPNTGSSFAFRNASQTYTVLQSTSSGKKVFNNTGTISQSSVNNNNNYLEFTCIRCSNGTVEYGHSGFRPNNTINNINYALTTVGMRIENTCDTNRVLAVWDVYLSDDELDKFMDAYRVGHNPVSIQTGVFVSKFITDNASRFWHHSTVNSNNNASWVDLINGDELSTFDANGTLYGIVVPTHGYVPKANNTSLLSSKNATKYDNQLVRKYSPFTIIIGTSGGITCHSTTPNISLGLMMYSNGLNNGKVKFPTVSSFSDSNGIDQSSPDYDMSNQSIRSIVIRYNGNYAEFMTYDSNNTKTVVCRVPHAYSSSISYVGSTFIHESVKVNIVSILHFEMYLSDGAIQSILTGTNISTAANNIISSNSLAIKPKTPNDFNCAFWYDSDDATSSGVKSKNNSMMLTYSGNVGVYNNSFGKCVHSMPNSTVYNGTNSYTYGINFQYGTVCVRFVPIKLFNRYIQLVKYFISGTSGATAQGIADTILYSTDSNGKLILSSYTTYNITSSNAETSNLYSVNTGIDFSLIDSPIILFYCFNDGDPSMYVYKNGEKLIGCSTSSVMTKNIVNEVTSSIKTSIHKLDANATGRNAKISINDTSLTSSVMVYDVASFDRVLTMREMEEICVGFNGKSNIKVKDKSMVNDNYYWLHDTNINPLITY